MFRGQRISNPVGSEERFLDPVTKFRGQRISNPVGSQLGYGLDGL